MNNLIGINSAIQKFLAQKIIDTPYIHLDLWSFMHLSSGLILGFIFAKFYKIKFAPWLAVLSLLIIYEIFEIFLTDILFEGETLVDTSWDLIVGMIGYSISFYILKIKKPR